MYTPGPWYIPEYQIDDFMINVNARHLVVACAFHKDPAQPTPTEYANARLIAAAPELVIALQDCLNYIDTTWEDWDSIDEYEPECRRNAIKLLERIGL